MFEIFFKSLKTRVNDELFLNLLTFHLIYLGKKTNFKT